MQALLLGMFLALVAVSLAWAEYSKQQQKKDISICLDGISTADNDKDIAACNRLLTSKRFQREILISIHFSRALMYHGAKQYPLCVQDTDWIIKATESCRATGVQIKDCRQVRAQSYSLRGGCQKELGNLKAAIADYRRAIGLGIGWALNLKTQIKQMQAKLKRPDTKR